MKKQLLTVFTSLGFTFFGIAQIGGNQVYNNALTSNNVYNYRVPTSSSVNQQSLSSTDSLLTITTSVLLNDVADSYLLTVGLNQEAVSVLECNTQINTRIKNVVKALNKLGINSEDTYVDFVTQTKVYDYEVSQNQAEQIEVGFEIKKNINIHFVDIALMDQIIEICAAEEIYDIINIEYLIDDINAIYERMFSEAMTIAEARKSTFEKYGSRKVSQNVRVLSDNFSSIFPKTQYKQYEAKESADLSVYERYANNNRFIRKEARKNKTFYYQGLAMSGYDKVIGMKNPKIGVQHSLTISVEYQLAKN